MVMQMRRVIGWSIRLSAGRAESMLNCEHLTRMGNVPEDCFGGGVGQQCAFR